MIYEGVITTILPEETVGANNLRKRTIVLEEKTDKEWKGGVAVDFLKDKCDLVSGLSVGDTVTAHINIRVNEYKGKRYNGITCWRIDSESEGGAVPAEGEAGFVPNTYSDDLPF